MLGRKLERVLFGTVRMEGAGSLLRNTGWLFVDRGFRFFITLTVNLWVTRYLGPERSGLLNAGLALAAMFSGIAELGLDSILRREVVRTPEAAGRLLGTAMVMRLIAAFPSILLFGVAFATQLGTEGRGQLGVALAITVLMPLCLTFDSWFLAQAKARFSVWGVNGALLVCALLRLLLVTSGAGVFAFGWAAAVETVLIGLFLALFYRLSGERMSTWHVDSNVMVFLWRNAWPLVLSNLAVLLYMRIDVVMIAAFRGDRDAGFFSAAVRLTELGNIVPMILVNAFFPSLARLKLSDQSLYLEQLQRLCTIVTWFTVVTALVLCVGSSLIVFLAYGEAFAPASPVLMLSAWSIVFACQGAARGQWLLLENLQHFGIWYVLIGAVVNVSLNLVLIPRFGPCGAAFATLTTHATVAFVAPLVFAPTRPGVQFLINAFLFRPAPNLSK